MSAEKGVWKQHLYSYNTEAATSVCLSCDQQGWGIPSSMLYVVVFKWWTDYQLLIYGGNKAAVIAVLSYSGPNDALPESCDYFLASCDQQLQYCLVHCRGPRVPYSIMTRYDGTARSLVPISLLEPNALLSESVTDVTLPTTSSFTVPSSSGRSLRMCTYLCVCVCVCVWLNLFVKSV